MIITIFLIIVSAIISMIGITFLYLNRKNFGSKITIFFNGSLYVVLGILFFTFFFLSSEISFREEISLIFWYLSIIFWIFSVSMFSIIHKYVINYEKQAVLSTLSYSLIFGIILGLSFIPNLYTIQLRNGVYSFFFNNLLLLSFILLYNTIIIGVMSYNLIKNFTRIRNSISRKMLVSITLEFSIIIVIYSFYILTRLILFKYLYSGFYLIGAFFVSFYLIKKPFLFIELTNRIYDFIIFHRSGILLYSFNFETGKESDESLLKGSILIGINH
ncbi:MAG: hypothetical protein ACFFCV_16815, partial [Promethearchaeota archaeon]